MCDYTTATPRNLVQHKQSTHEGIRYPCDECDFSALKKSHLFQHKRIKHEGIRYQCDQCEFATGRNHHLKRHRENKHEGVTYPCPECDYAAGQKGTLMKHIQSRHTNNNAIRQGPARRVPPPSPSINAYDRGHPNLIVKDENPAQVNTLSPEHRTETLHHVQESDI